MLFFYMENISKRNRIQLAAMQLFQEQGVDSTSVNEIVKRANVAKGTFYVYYKDKKELISQILTKKHGRMLNDLLNTSYEKAMKEGKHWMLALVEEMISFYENNPDILRMIQKNITNTLDTMEHRNQVLKEIERLQDILSILKKEHESTRQALNKFVLIMETTSFLCYNAIFYQQPDSLKEIKPLIMDTVEKLCK